MARDADLPLVRLAELEIYPEQLGTYLDLLRDEIEASIAVEPGVVSLNAVAVKGRSNHIRIIEVYADVEAYEAHLLTPHFLKYKTMTAGMVRSLHLIETEPVLLRSKP